MKYKSLHYPLSICINAKTRRTLCSGSLMEYKICQIYFHSGLGSHKKTHQKKSNFKFKYQEKGWRGYIDANKTLIDNWLIRLLFATCRPDVVTHDSELTLTQVTRPLAHSSGEAALLQGPGTCLRFESFQENRVQLGSM